MSDHRGVQSVARALDILSAFSAAHSKLQLRDLADVVGLPKSSTHRLASTLLERGFLRQEPDGSYCLGSRLLELGGLVSNTSALANRTGNAMNSLSLKTGETILVAEVDWMDNTVLITHKVDATHPLSVASPVGKRSGLGNGCIGKAILGAMNQLEASEVIDRLHLVHRTDQSILDADKLRADVATARRRGWASESNEFIEGVSGVAAAVSSGERPLGALAIIAPTSRAGRQRLQDLGKLLVATLADQSTEEAQQSIS